MMSYQGGPHTWFETIPAPGEPSGDPEGHAGRLPDRRPVKDPRTERPRVRASVGSRLRHPQTTVRWRLTLLYGGTFLMCGAVLLAVTFVPAPHQITGGWGIETPPSPALPRRIVDAPPSAGDTVPVPAPSLKMPTVPPAVLHIIQSPAGQEFLRLPETPPQV